MKLFKIFSKRKPKAILFIFGCQRSGTTMLTDLLEKCPEFSVYGEGNKKAMMLDNYRIKDEKIIKNLILRDNKKYIVFKPLNDSQNADNLLNTFPNSKAIWIYREYPDTINSAVKKWNSVQKQIILWLKNYSERENAPIDDPHKCSIYAERVPPETFATIRELAHDNMTDAEGAALIWYIRNKIYFDLNLQDNKNVLLVKYEDLVKNPIPNLDKIFEFIGFPDSKDYSDSIFSSSILKNPAPPINYGVEKLCRNMMDRFDNIDY